MVMGLLTPAAGFVFLDPGPLVDAELELVEPAAEWVEDMLQACHHPLTRRGMPHQARHTHDSLLTYVRQHPRGRQPPDFAHGIVPAYTFWMRLLRDGPGTPPPPVPFAGSISLRLGRTRDLELYFGHIGYHVYPPARGRHYAARSCRLLLGLARAHGFASLWITCNPDNIASRRTCERLGGVLVEIVPVPPENALYSQGDREKCRYRVDL